MGMLIASELRAASFPEIKPLIILTPSTRFHLHVLLFHQQEAISGSEGQMWNQR